MVENTVRILLDVASQARIDLDGDKLAETIILSPREPFFHSIQNDLFDCDIEIEQTVADLFPHYDDKEMAGLYSNLLRYIALVNWDGGRSSDPVGEYEALLAVYKNAAKIFSQRGPNVSWFTPVLRKIAAYLVRCASKADASVGNAYAHKHVETLTRLLHGPFSLAAADSVPDVEDRRGATFFLANFIFEMYFEIDNIRLCDTIMKNLEKQLGRLHEFPRADQTMFHFWRGRIYLSQQKLRPALGELSRSFQMCTNQNRPTKRIALQYMIVASLPLGIFPNSVLLHEFSLTQQFSRIIRSMKLGNIALFRRSLFQWRKWFAKRGLWLLLKEKCEVLVWRSLVRRTHLCIQAKKLSAVTKPSPEAKEAPPNVALADILCGLRFSALDNSYNLHDVESMICSLLEQKYIVGYYHHTHLTLVLRKVSRTATTGGFPPPASIVVQDSNGPGESVLPLPGS